VRPDGVFGKRRGADLCHRAGVVEPVFGVLVMGAADGPVLRVPRRQQRRVAHLLALRT
jgi:hypothetical protein